jgi:hypothetical protein
VADFAPPTDSIRTSPIVRSTNLAALEVAQSSPEMIDVDSILTGSPETILTSTKAATRSSSSPEPSDLVDFSEGLESAPNLAVPEAQLLVNGLTEAQAWYLGWLRDSTRSQELLAVIDCFEVQTRRKNEIAPPPICSMELPKMKAGLAAAGRDTGR